MRPDLFLAHTALSRRSALGLAGAAALGVAGLTGASPAAAAGPSEAMGGAGYDDVMFDVAFAEGGGWAPSRYGPTDQRGTFNEVTAAKTASALRLLADGYPVKTYNLGELDPVAFGRIVARKRVLDGRQALDRDTWEAAGWTYRALGRRAG